MRLLLAEDVSSTVSNAAPFLPYLRLRLLLAEDVSSTVSNAAPFLLYHIYIVGLVVWVVSTVKVGSYAIS